VKAAFEPRVEARAETLFVKAEPEPPPPLHPSETLFVKAEPEPPTPLAPSRDSVRQGRTGPPAPLHPSETLFVKAEPDPRFTCPASDLAISSKVSRRSGSVARRGWPGPLPRPVRRRRPRPSVPTPWSGSRGRSHRSWAPRVGAPRPPRPYPRTECARRRRLSSPGRDGPRGNFPRLTWTSILAFAFWGISTAAGCLREIGRAHV